MNDGKFIFKFEKYTELSAWELTAAEHKSLRCCSASGVNQRGAAHTRISQASEPGMK